MAVVLHLHKRSLEGSIGIPIGVEAAQPIEVARVSGGDGGVVAILDGPVVVVDRSATCTSSDCRSVS
jgi:hypothetical protein